MYKIIGGDKKEYGPVTADELRRWIAEGRLNVQSLVRAEGTTEWLPLASFPEFAEALGVQTEAASASSFGGAKAPAPSVEDLMTRQPEVRIGECLSRSWTLLKSNMALLYTACFVVWLPLLLQVIPLIGGLLYLLIFGVLYGGLYLVFLRRIRGEPAAVGDAFSGFTIAPGQLVLAGLVSGLLTGLGMCCCVPGIYLWVAWIFCLPLVSDQRLEFWSAMELSRKVVTRVWFPMLGLLILAFLPTIIGHLVVNIFAQSPGFPGLEEMIRSGQFDPKRLIEVLEQIATANLKLTLLTQAILLINMPFAVGALMYAYENLFGTRTARTP